MNKRNLSKSDFEDHLRDLIGELQRATLEYDTGYYLAARRIAVSLRVLLHTGKGNTISLIKQIYKQDIDFVDTASPVSPRNFLQVLDLEGREQPIVWEVRSPSHGLLSMNFEGSQVSYEARLDSGEPVARTPFEDWWRATVFEDGQMLQMSRADVVLTAADQDGGAHVDKSLRADYAALRYENSLGWLTHRGTPPSGDPCYAAIRQVAHEVLKTLIPEYSRTQEEARACRRKTELSGGRLRFAPHEKVLLKREINPPPMCGKLHAVIISVESITTGSIRIVVNSAETEAITLPGIYEFEILAGQGEHSGIRGEYTDAVIQHFGIQEVPQQ